MKLGEAFQTEPLTVILAVGTDDEDMYVTSYYDGMWRESASASDDSDGTRRDGKAVTVQIPASQIASTEGIDGQALVARGTVNVSGTRREVIDALEAEGNTYAKVREVIDRRRDVDGIPAEGLASYLSCVVLECR